MDWFLYYNGLRHERANQENHLKKTENVFLWTDSVTVNTKKVSTDEKKDGQPHS